MTLLALSETLHQALRLALVLALPPLAAVLIVGLGLDGLRLATKIRDPGSAAALRVGAALVALAASGPWIFAQLERFTATLLGAIARGG